MLPLLHAIPAEVPEGILGPFTAVPALEPLLDRGLLAPGGWGAGVPPQNGEGRNGSSHTAPDYSTIFREERCSFIQRPKGFQVVGGVRKRFYLCHSCLALAGGPKR